jgi:hypothetical protein
MWLNHQFSSAKTVEQLLKLAVNNILKLPPIPVKAKYLGLPLFFSRKKQDSFLEIKDRIFAKISGWKAKLLSQAARTTLIKAVANAIPFLCYVYFFAA